MMSGDLQEWLSGDDAEHTLEKFDDTERPEVVQALQQIGLRMRDTLKNYTKTMMLTRQPEVIEYLANRPEFSGLVVNYIIKEEVNGAMLASWSEEELKLIELATARIRNLVLPEEHWDERIADCESKLIAGLDFYSPQFEGRAVAGGLYGSMIFGDPSADKMDIDMHFLVSDKTEDQDPHLKEVAPSLSEDIGIKIDSSVLCLTELEKFVTSTSIDDLLSTGPGKCGGWMVSCHAILFEKIIELPSANHQKIASHIARLKQKILERCTTDPVFAQLIILQCVKDEEIRLKKDRPARIRAEE